MVGERPEQVEQPQVQSDAEKSAEQAKQKLQEDAQTQPRRGGEGRNGAPSDTPLIDKLRATYGDQMPLVRNAPSNAGENALTGEQRNNKDLDKAEKAKDLGVRPTGAGSLSPSPGAPGSNGLASRDNPSSERPPGNGAAFNPGASRQPGSGALDTGAIGKRAAGTPPELPPYGFPPGALPPAGGPPVMPPGDVQPRQFTFVPGQPEDIPPYQPESKPGMRTQDTGVPAQKSPTADASLDPRSLITDLPRSPGPQAPPPAGTGTVKESDRQALEHLKNSPLGVPLIVGQNLKAGLVDWPLDKFASRPQAAPLPDVKPGQPPERVTGDAVKDAASGSQGRPEAPRSGGNVVPADAVKPAGDKKPGSSPQSTPEEPRHSNRPGPDGGNPSAERQAAANKATNDARRDIRVAGPVPLPADGSSAPPNASGQAPAKPPEARPATDGRQSAAQDLTHAKAESPAKPGVDTKQLQAGALGAADRQPTSPGQWQKQPAAQVGGDRAVTQSAEARGQGRSDVGDKPGDSGKGSLRAEQPAAKAGQPPLKEQADAGGARQAAQTDSKGGKGGGDIPIPLGGPGIDFGGKGTKQQPTGSDPAAQGGKPPKDGQLQPGKSGSGSTVGSSAGGAVRGDGTSKADKSGGEGIKPEQAGVKGEKGATAGGAPGAGPAAGKGLGDGGRGHGGVKEIGEGPGRTGTDGTKVGDGVKISGDAAGRSGIDGGRTGSGIKDGTGIKDGLGIKGNQGVEGTKSGARGIDIPVVLPPGLPGFGFGGKGGGKPGAEGGDKGTTKGSSDGAGTGVGGSRGDKAGADGTRVGGEIKDGKSPEGKAGKPPDVPIVLPPRLAGIDFSGLGGVKPSSGAAPGDKSVPGAAQPADKGGVPSSPGDKGGVPASPGKAGIEAGGKPAGEGTKPGAREGHVPEGRGDRIPFIPVNIPPGFGVDPVGKGASRDTKEGHVPEGRGDRIPFIPVNIPPGYGLDPTGKGAPRAPGADSGGRGVAQAPGADSGGRGGAPAPAGHDAGSPSARGDRATIPGAQPGDKPAPQAQTVGDRGTTTQSSAGDKTAGTTAAFGDKSGVPGAQPGEKTTVPGAQPGEKSTMSLPPAGDKTASLPGVPAEKSSTSTSTPADKWSTAQGVPGEKPLAPSSPPGDKTRTGATLPGEKQGLPTGTPGEASMPLGKGAMKDSAPADQTLDAKPLRSSEGRSSDGYRLPGLELVGRLDRNHPDRVRATHAGQRPEKESDTRLPGDKAPGKDVRYKPDAGTTGGEQVMRPRFGGSDAASVTDTARTLPPVEKSTADKLVEFVRTRRKALEQAMGAQGQWDPDLQEFARIMQELDASGAAGETGDYVDYGGAELTESTDTIKVADGTVIRRELRRGEHGEASGHEQERHVYIVQADDTLESIADHLYHDRRIGALIHELNKDTIPSTYLYDRIIVELKPGIALYLPTYEEIQSYYEQISDSDVSVFEYSQGLAEAEHELETWEQSRRGARDAVNPYANMGAEVIEGMFNALKRATEAAESEEPEHSTPADAASPTE